MNPKRYTQPAGTTAGKCVLCKLLYFWKPGRSRRLRNAICPCGEPLQRTAVASLRAACGLRVADVWPNFISDAERNGGVS